MLFRSDKVTHINDMFDHLIDKVTHINDMFDHLIDNVTHINDMFDHLLDKVTHINDMFDKAKTHYFNTHINENKRKEIFICLYKKHQSYICSSLCQTPTDTIHLQNRHLLTGNLHLTFGVVAKCVTLLIFKFQISCHVTIQC